MERNQTKIQSPTIENYNKSVASLRNLWKTSQRNINNKDKQLMKYGNYLYNLLVTMTAGLQ